MIFGRSKLELKVGIFVFVGLLILIFFVLLIGDIRTWTSGYNARFKFGFVAGVRIGAPIRFAGVDVGEVKKINIIFDSKEQKTEVEMVGWLSSKVNIPKDSTVWVNTLGLLGEKYIEIMPGKNYGQLLKANDILTGVDPIAMHEVIGLARQIASDLDQSIVRLNNEEGTLGKLLYDDAIYKELEALVIDIRKHPWKLFIKGKE